MENTLYFM